MPKTCGSTATGSTISARSNRRCSRSTAKIPGLGDVPWGQWIGALTDAGYNGPVCVEVEDEAFHDTLEGRKRSLRISHRVLQPLIA